MADIDAFVQVLFEESTPYYDFSVVMWTGAIDKREFFDAVAYETYPDGHQDKYVISGKTVYEVSQKIPKEFRKFQRRCRRIMRSEDVSQI
jgi:hypothetical protein